MRIVVTGHRPKDLNQDSRANLRSPFFYQIGNLIKDYLLTQIERVTKEGEGEKIILITGMATGIDTIFGLVGCKLKSKYPDIIEIECFIPFKDHKPKTYNRDNYEFILSVADKEILVCDENYEKDGIGRPWLLTNRNKAMVDSLIPHSNDHVLAVWTGKKKGGTYDCMKRALKQEFKIYHIDPVNLTTQWFTNLEEIL